MGPAFRRYVPIWVCWPCAALQPDEPARSISEERAERRVAAPDEWNAFRTETIASLRQAFAEVQITLEKKVFEDLGALLDAIRAMNTDTCLARQGNCGRSWSLLSAAATHRLTRPVACG